MKLKIKSDVKARVALTTLFLSISFTPVCVAQIDFSKLQPATTPKEANDRFEERKQVVIKFNKCQLLTNEKGQLREYVAIAKLEAGDICDDRLENGRLTTQTKDNITLANEEILKKQKTSRNRVGSGCDDIPGCDYEGDYDMGLVELIAIAHRYGPYGPQNQLIPGGFSEAGHRNKLWPDVYKHLLYGFPSGTEPLLSERGPHEASIEKVCFHGICVPETENHILMIETSRYLTNQLLLRGGGDPKLYDNKKNGFTDWMLRHLQRFLQNDFEEYNARPYSLYATMAIQNLYEYTSDDDPVKTAARMVLDYQEAKFAVSSNGLRRIAPFRRRDEYKDRSELFDKDSDAQTLRFIMLSGSTQLLPGQIAPSEAAEIMQMIAVGRYRVPDLILDLAMDKSHGAYYQRFYHASAEVYWSTPEFLISAGGFWNPSAHSDVIGDEFNCYKDVGWAQPTTLMPAAAGVDYKDFIRIEGERGSTLVRPGGEITKLKVPYVGDVSLGVKECVKKDSERVNTCVAPGFACGINPIVPPFYLGRGCTHREPWTHWTFVEAPKCNPDFQFYVAVYGDGERFGFFEARSSKGLNFDTFKSGVLRKNPSLNLQPEAINEYVTSDDRHIRFIPKPADKYHWGIVSYGDPPCPARDRRDIGKWPLAEGGIINSDGHTGYMTIDNPFLNQRLILDLRDHRNPQRSEIRISEAGFSPTEVWVDFNYGGTNQCGTFEFPYKTLVAGVNAIPWNGAVLRIKAGSGTESIRINKRMVIKTSNGAATIGRH